MQLDLIQVSPLLLFAFLFGPALMGEYNLAAAGISEDDAFFCALSSATLVYKGQLTPEQARPPSSLPISWYLSERFEGAG